jgi:MFS transporter, ACS family, hexuronate transporter
MNKLPNLRWGIVSLLFFASVLNYVDRQTLSILAPTIQKELNMSDVAYANIANLFLVAYTISYVASGRVTDKFGTRVSMALFVGWWSLANMATGLARSVSSLGFCRFFLGLGEAGNYTVAPKVVADWFPSKERGLAIGIYTLGATVGATIAPIIVVALERFHSWQAAFIVTGLMGFVWLVPWLLFFHPVDSHPKLSEAQRGTLREAQESSEEKAPIAESEAASWREVFARREVWVLMIGRMLTDPVWYFYQFWLAKYLAADRGLQQAELGITWIVFLAADAGALLGGLLSGKLIANGKSAPAARMAVMLVCAALMPLSLLVAKTPSLNLSLALCMILVLSHLMWMINLSALVVDRIPRRIIATAFGVVAAGSTVGGMVMNSVVATMVSGPSTKPGGFWDEGVKLVLSPVLPAIQGHGYAMWFLVAAFLHPLTWVFLRAMGMHKPASA